MVVIVTRDVAERFRGFLASCMLEIAPGVYTAARMNPGARERVWAVLCDWHASLGGSLVMTWRDRTLPAGQGVKTLGDPPKELVLHDGIHLVRRTPPTPPAPRPL